MIKSELERVHNHFDAIIGSYATFPDIRKESRDIVFELIALENSLNIESDIAIRSAIATVNKQIADPKFRIKLNLKSAAEINKKEFKLTKKEVEILALLPKGLSIKDMALRLYLTEATIKSHMYSIYKKLEVSNRVQAIAKARENNLLNF